MAKKIPLKPLGTRVLLRELEEKGEQGGIILPEDAEGSKFRRGEVLALGNAVGSEDEEIKLKVGDTVLIDSFLGKEVEYDGQEYLIVKSTDVLAVLE